MEHANSRRGEDPTIRRASLVGAGRVAGSLGHWLETAGLEVHRIASRSGRSAAALAEAFGAAPVPVEELTTSGDTLLLIAVPDPALPDLARELARRPQAAVALHTAGSVGAEVLAPLRQAGSAVGCMHPLRAFVDTVPPSEAEGTFFAIDGDEPAMRLATELARAWSSHAEIVPPESRLLYHLAATLAAGGVVTLLAAASRLAEAVGIGPAVRDGYLALAEGALANVRSGVEPALAITGPAARGEVDLLGRQFESLAGGHPDLTRLLAAIVRETVLDLERAGRPVENGREVLELVASWDPPVPKGR